MAWRDLQALPRQEEKRGAEVIWKIKECKYISFISSNNPSQFYGMLRTPKHRLPMWVGALWPRRSQAFAEARQHIARFKWKLIPDKGGRRKEPTNG